MGKQWDALKDPRVTDEGLWKAPDDCHLPNPPFDSEQEEEVLDEANATKKHDTKVIMAHEFRENPEGYKAMRQAVADAYNETDTLIVGEPLEEALDEKTNWKSVPMTGRSKGKEVK